MGYFANLYVAELTSNDAGIESHTSVYGNEINEKAYFSFGEGQRPPGLHIYASGAVASDVELKLLSSYPLAQVEGTDPDSCLFEAGFIPRAPDNPVLYHFLLPAHFIPRRDLLPLDQPGYPFIARKGDRLSVTYPVTGAATFRFWIERLKEGRSLEWYDLERLLHPDEKRGVKVGIEFNLGFFKLKIDEAK